MLEHRGSPELECEAVFEALWKCLGYRLCQAGLGKPH